MAKTQIVPWLLPTDDAAPAVERIEVSGIAIEIPVLGSVTVDEARYLEWHNEHHGLGGTALMPTATAVYHLLLLRFGVAAWSGEELVRIGDELPTFDQTMSHGTPARMMPADLITQVYAFFLDEFMANLGKPRTALTEERERQAHAVRTTGQISTGDSSDTTPAATSEGHGSGELQSTLLEVPLPPEKPTTSKGKAVAIAA